MAIMVYFKDENGLELPFSGSCFAWCGAFANDGSKANRTQIEVARGKKRYMLTAKSFSAKRISVKVWAPRGSEYWTLVPGPVQAVDMPTEWVVHPDHEMAEVGA